MKKQLPYPRKLLFTSQGGGVLLRAVIVFVTLCIVGGAIYILLHQIGQKQQIYHRKALAICEYGLMVALQRVQTGPFVPGDIPKTEYNEGWYTVSFDRHVQHDTVFLAIRAEGRVGAAAERRECILRQDIRGQDTSWIRESMH
jgi:hypothetical protein